MKLQIRGKYSKKNNHWKVEILPLGLSFEAVSAMQAFHLLHKYLKREIHKDLGCDIRIQDNGEFIIVTHTNHPQFYYLIRSSNRHSLSVANAKVRQDQRGEPMNAKIFQDFFLVTSKEPGTDEEADIKPVSDEFFEVTPLPVIFNSRKCIRTRKDKTIKIMSLKEIKRAS